MTLQTSTCGPTLAMHAVARRRRLSAFSILLVLIALGPPACAISMQAPTSLYALALRPSPDCRKGSVHFIDPVEARHQHCSQKRIAGLGKRRFCVDHLPDWELSAEERSALQEQRVGRKCANSRPAQRNPGCAM